MVPAIIMEENKTIEQKIEQKIEYKIKIEDIRKMIVFLKSETIKEIIIKKEKN